LERDTWSPATGWKGWKGGRGLTELTDSFERKLDAQVFGDLLLHRFHLGVGIILHAVLSGFGTLGQYRVSQVPFTTLTFPDGRVGQGKRNSCDQLQGRRIGLPGAFGVVVVNAVM
jgi:hypothetical protein